MDGTARIDARTGLEVLSREECVHLLATHHLGRLAVVVAGRPHLFPVSYCLDGERVVFRTDPGSKLYGARGMPVAFEIDGADAYYHRGWSVVVHGTGVEVVEPDERRRLACLPLGVWVNGPKQHWISIEPTEISGRRIPQHGLH